MALRRTTLIDINKFRAVEELMKVFSRIVVIVSGLNELSFAANSRQHRVKC